MASPAIIKKIFIIVRLQHATIVITRIVQKGAGIMAEHILVVDDEKDIANLVAVYLKNEGYEVTTALSGKDALAYIDSTRFDLAVLDVMLPDTDGFQLCAHIREKYQYPIIMLTAKGEAHDKINGLILGADDYVTKPFLPLELVARVKAQLRRYKRYNAPVTEDVLLQNRGLVMNTSTHVCTLNEVPLALTPTEFAILKVLLQNEGAVVSAESIFRTIWSEEHYTKNNSISVHIRKLREKMNDSFETPKYIRTVWGCGYKIEK